MVRVLTAGDDNLPEVAGNLQKARNSWVRMLRIMSREGVDLKVSGHFFKVVVQAVLLFGAKTWVLTPQMERDLSNFQHRVAQRLTVRHPRRQGGGSWEYPPLEAEVSEAGIDDIGVYITRRQNTVAQYIATRPILGLCKQSV